MHYAHLSYHSPLALYDMQILHYINCASVQIDLYFFSCTSRFGANSRGIEPPARKPKDNTDVVLFYWLYSLFLSTVALIKIANENQMSPTTHFFIFGP